MFSRYIFPDKKTEKAATHQRLDRAARRQIARHLPKGLCFPTAKEIIHFEGMNGPDGLASKKGAYIDEPYQFIPPDFSDTRLLVCVKNHLYNLHEATKADNRVRMSFEAAWMAHMIVDGLSPPHHQPLKEQLRELDNRELSELKSRISRIITPGTNMKEFFELNWKRMGPRGVGTNHVMFEAGVDFLLMPYTTKQLVTSLHCEDIKRAKNGEYISMFKKSVEYIDSYQMFERYERDGWTEALAHDVRDVMVPEMIKMISLGWLAGIYKGE
ncbi:MAG: hypothetical protein LBH36_01695 [Candidatus Nomurabacteria bacterium]|jgi:hypothetical protein|nr:hypothetical protein [Candidatus Nomurabacteria bacterium]